MANAIALSMRDVRLVHLAAQGMIEKVRIATSDDVLAAISRMELLQIDTINVVARSPYLVLYARLGDYDPAWLDASLADGKIFECWAHEACFAPMSTLALHHPDAQHRAAHWATKRGARTRREEGPALDALLEHIRKAGPVLARDFTTPRKDPSGWWGWKNEKRWLEALFATGALMIARRDRFQRVYDLRERVLARAGVSEAPKRMPLDVRREMIVRAIRALGLAKRAWIADYFRLGKRVTEDEIASLIREEEIAGVNVKGETEAFFFHRACKPLIDSVVRGELRAKRSAFLSPFDPIVWDRRRARELFGFDYQIECYTKEENRHYGYFTLPILHRGALIGRMDAKAHRNEGRFEVKSFHLEPNVALSTASFGEIARGLVDLAAWHRTPKVTLGRCRPAQVRSALKKALDSAFEHRLNET
jgi:uncharacterized protein